MDKRRIEQYRKQLLKKEEELRHLVVQSEQDVQKKRLEAVPWARHGIGCQEKQEQGLL